MQRLHFLLAALASLLVAHTAYPMKKISKKSFKKINTHFFTKHSDFSKNFKRNIIIATACLNNPVTKNKVLLLSDLHESAEDFGPDIFKLTNAHTDQMFGLINTIRHTKNASFFVEFGEINKKHIDNDAVNEPILINKTRKYLHTQTIPYVNFDSRDTTDMLMSILLIHTEEYIQMRLQGTELPKELCITLGSYLKKLQTKQQTTLLAIDNSNIKEPLKTDLIGYGYELTNGIRGFLEEITAHHKISHDTLMLDVIYFIQQRYNRFPLHKLLAEGSFNPDVNLYTKLLQKKEHLSVVFGGGMHCAFVESYLKKSDFETVQEEKNGTKIDFQNYIIKFPKAVPLLFLNDSIQKFIG